VSVSYRESQRLDYDRIADRYDVDHYRGKDLDPDLVAFLAERSGSGVPCSVLDVGCGTGNQLVVDQAHVPEARLVGLDLFHGMLCQARIKSAHVAWVQGDGARLPLRAGSFDYVTNQFSFHHIRDKASMLREVYRVLRPQGRFVMINIAPREMPGWAMYRFFPAAWERDLADFLPIAEIESLLRGVGFARVDIERDHLDLEQDLGDLVQAARLRVVSQVALLSEVDYSAGISRLEAELQKAGGRAVSVPSVLCLVKINADKE
jgi:ubiquinone/menaquinone biosynthesis C-methylase UbiE